MIYYQSGSENKVISARELEEAINNTLSRLGNREKVLVIPPDYTRFHSRAGEITSLIHKYYGNRLADILPALGTHSAMTPGQISRMYRDIPAGLFRVHNWRKDVVTTGIVPGEFVSAITEGKIDYSWPAQLNNLVFHGGHDLIISVGQVVPHEVAGMANYNKNLFIGTGGAEGINKSHFIGAVYGMERMMGKTDTPVRKLLNYASENFISSLPVLYIHTVIGFDEQGHQVIRGLFIGDDESVFTNAAALSVKVNFSVYEEPFKKVVVFLDPSEYKSTWLGNKSIYRTRMAMADGGELIILAPGLKEFGEDREIDTLIRRFGYFGTQATLDLLTAKSALSNNLSAAAHLIHGSSEGRFTITYCPGNLSKEEIESVNFNYADLNKMIGLYNPARLKEGFNKLPGGEEFFYISNPALGLWAAKNRLK
jgi:nickel-dependent lactate racemase